MKLKGTITMLGLAFGLVSSMAASAPTCALKCWENSKYVSTCHNVLQCLCEEAEFQSTVLQCLYSQCQTTQFGPALHHALSECSDYPSTGPVDLPPLIRHKSLRKRTGEDQSLASVRPLVQSAVRPLVSAHAPLASAGVLNSVKRRYISPSVVPNLARPTRSAYNILNSVAHNSQKARATKTLVPPGLDDVGFNEKLAPSGAAAASASAPLITSLTLHESLPHARTLEVQSSVANPASVAVTSTWSETSALTEVIGTISTTTIGPLATGSVNLGPSGFTNPTRTGTDLTYPRSSETGVVRVNSTLSYERSRRARWPSF